MSTHTTQPRVRIRKASMISNMNSNINKQRHLWLDMIPQKLHLTYLEKEFTLWQRKKIRENIILSSPFINLWSLETILLSWNYVNKIIFLISSHFHSWCILTGELWVVASLIHATSTCEIENMVIDSQLINQKISF